MVQSKNVKNRILKTIKNTSLLLFTTNFRKNSKKYSKLYKKKKKPVIRKKRLSNYDLQSIPTSDLVKKIGISYFQYCLVVLNYKQEIKEGLEKESLLKLINFPFAILLTLHRLKK
jgi:hypothetical protein